MKTPQHSCEVHSWKPGVSRIKRNMRSSALKSHGELWLTKHAYHWQVQYFAKKARKTRGTTVMSWKHVETIRPIRVSKMKFKKYWKCKFHLQNMSSQPAFVQITIAPHCAKSASWTNTSLEISIKLIQGYNIMQHPLVFSLQVFFCQHFFGKPMSLPLPPSLLPANVRTK